MDEHDSQRIHSQSAVSGAARRITLTAPISDARVAR